MEPEGKLYIVATPIGNREDITLRALRILAEVDLIAAEDTRRTGRLLAHYSIKKPLVSCFEHNERRRAQQIIRALKDGKNVALVSEAGTPLISDPGYRLVESALHASINVVPVPGACAAVAALSVSGLGTDRFAFEGFVPAKKGKRLRFFTQLVREERTLVFYESPHRIIATLRAMAEVFGDRPVAVFKELTKLHEECFYGTVTSILTLLQSRPVKGEYTIVLAAPSDHKKSSDKLTKPDHVLKK